MRIDESTPQTIDYTPQNIADDTQITGGKLPSGIDEAMADGDKEAQHPKRRDFVY